MTTLCLSHKENEKNGLNKNVKVISKLKLKNKTSSNEEFINEMHKKFLNIYIFNFLKL